jgi:hypothetical protein
MIEDRLTVLNEKDDWEREVLLTTDVENQILHLKAIRRELDVLKSQ